MTRGGSAPSLSAKATMPRSSNVVGNAISARKGRILRLVLAAGKQREIPDSRSDAGIASEQGVDQGMIEAKRSELRNGLTCRQRMFILEKLVGRSDKDAALSAGYSLSVAENTKQRIWKPPVRAEFEQLRRGFGGSLQG
jgi:hypothetical protein